jgi:hypothetical protein
MSCLNWLVLDVLPCASLQHARGVQQSTTSIPTLLCMFNWQTELRHTFCMCRHPETFCEEPSECTGQGKDCPPLYKEDNTACPCKASQDEG